MGVSFSAKLWIYPGNAAWHFVTVPKKESEKVKVVAKKAKRGWGSVRVRAKIGKTSFDTSVFPDTKSGTYLLPVKAAVRRKEGLDEGETLKVTLHLIT